MRRPLIVLLTIILLAASWQGGAERPMEPEVQMPQVLFTDLPSLDPVHPIFVAADAAIHSDGEVNTALFPDPAAVKVLRSLLDQPASDGCILTEAVYREDPAPDRFTLKEGAQRSELVFTARVKKREFGFRGEEAGQLIAVSPLELIKGDALQLDTYFIFFPAGDFKAGPFSIRKIDRGYPPPPEVGDTLMLMIPRFEESAAPYLDLANAASVIVVPADTGTPQLPYTYRDSVESPTSQREVLSRVRQAVASTVQTRAKSITTFTVDSKIIVGVAATKNHPSNTRRIK